MVQLVVLSGAFLLMGFILFAAFRRRKAPPPLPEIQHLNPEELEKHLLVAARSQSCKRTLRPILPRGVQKLAQRILRCRETLAPLAYLHENGCEFLLALLTLRSNLRSLPRLPGSQEPRMQSLCRRYLALGGDAGAAHLLAFLSACQSGCTLTLRERLHLPECLGAVLAEHLHAALLALLQSIIETRRGARLAHRLSRVRRPMELLNAQRLSTTETQAMVHWLQAHHQAALLAAIEGRMRQADYSLLQLAEDHAAHQARVTDQLSRILAEFRTLRKLDWPTLQETADPLHQLFLHDPTGTYPAMAPESRMLYRQRAAALSRLFSVDETRLAKEILALCSAADPDGLRDHVGWYLLEHQGIWALQRHLQVRRGFLRLCLWRFAPWIRRFGLAGAGLALALAFLHSGHPLWALPVFLGVASQLTHFLSDTFTRCFPQPPLPQMQVDAITGETRTLIVLPVTLSARSQPVHAVRQLLLARKAFPPGEVDCLLLADYAPCLTQSSSEDAAITEAARIAIAAVDGDGGQFMYLHRRRSWDGLLRAYSGRDGLMGAMDSLNQLLVHGQCADAFDEATLPPTALHRRYAYVLALAENSVPAPDSLLQLAGILSHPLNQRCHTAEGIRGFSLLYPSFKTDLRSVRTQVGLYVDHNRPESCLYHPYSLMDAAENYLPLQPELVSELSGSAQARAVFYAAAPHSVVEWLSQLRHFVRNTWRTLPWLFSHVKSSAGVRRNPLDSHSRYRLRQALRITLLPLCRLLLLLYGVLARSLPLTLFALLIPALPHPAPGCFITQLCTLPLQSAITLDALLDALWHTFFPRRKRPEWLSSFSANHSAWENWSQGLAAIAFAAASLAITPISLPGLVLAGCFACFPLLHPWLDAPLRTLPRPTPGMEASLLEIAQATWQFFEETVTASTQHLPVETLQLKPRRGADNTTSPGNIGMYLLSCLAMRELGLISTQDMCARVSLTMTTLEKLPLWHGLPYRQYRTDTLVPAGAADVSATECGILCACLMALAQGLRSYLPETPENFVDLPHQADSFASRMELHRLYDPHAQLFFTAWHAETETFSTTHLELLASESLLLSFAALTRRQAPATHLEKLNRSLVALGRSQVCISRTGTAAEYLLPALFLPAAPHTLLDRTIQGIVRTQQRLSVEGMFGLSESCCWQLDAQMNYLRRPFGIPGAALEPCPPRTVIAPYAAALCLPFQLEKAHESLMRLRSRGMLGRLGFYESIDFEPPHQIEGSGEAVVQCHVSLHQGLLLCALCNALTGHVLAHHFASLPPCAAFLPLLHNLPASRLLLPAHVLHPQMAAPREASFRRSAQADIAPLDAHIIGNQGATLLMSAQGMGAMFSRGIALAPFTGDPTQAEGMQFYLNNGLETYRLTDPHLPGDTAFFEGQLRFIRTCGQLQSTLTALTDPVQGAFLHVIQVANLTNHHRTFDLFSRFVPLLSENPLDAPSPLEIGRPEERVITVTRRGTTGPSLTLCHAISTHETLLDLTAENTPLSFRTRMKVAPRGRAAVVFVTRLMTPGEVFTLEALSPRLSEVDSLADLSALLSRTVTDTLSITQSRAAELTRLFGPLMWRGQPHQGAITPLSQPASALRGLGLEPDHPLLLLIAHSDGCTELLRDACDTIQWMRLMGLPAQLCVLCQGDQSALARNAAWGLLRNQPATLLTASELPEGLRETIEAAARVILYEGSGTVTAQLEALALRLPPSIPAEPAPGAPQHPAEELLFGGFQPGTEDYILHPNEEHTPSEAMCNPLAGGTFTTNTTGSGLGESHLQGSLCVASAEYICLSTENDLFTPTPAPLGQGLSHRVAFAPGITTWHSLGRGLDMTLTAATVADAAFGCRTLRIKNSSQQEQRFTLTIAARFLMGETFADESFTCLTPVDGGVVAASPQADCYGCLALAEGTCQSRSVSPMAFHGFGASLNPDAPDDEAGTLALLQLPLVLPAGGSTTTTWLLGACRQMDEAELLLERLRKHGATAVYRQVRQLWSQRLGRLTISTPDDGLNLLMNRVLPWQVHTSAGSLWDTALLLYTDPGAARALLTADHPAPSDGAQLLLPCMVSRYILHTGDKTILEEALYTRCMQALTSIRLGQQGLPIAAGKESIPLSLFFADVLHHFAPHAQAEDRIEIHTVHDRLLESLERAAPRVEQAWQQLFSSRRITSDAPILWMFSSLCQHQDSRAWALLQAMNPLHRSVFPLSELPCAGFLYAAILEKLLGFEKRGHDVRLRPMVPPDWDGFTITLQWGGSTWRFHAGENEPFLTLDSQQVTAGWITLADDGRIHEVRTPLRQG